jgi:hypothetical protein
MSADEISAHLRDNGIVLDGDGTGEREFEEMVAAAWRKKPGRPAQPPKPPGERGRPPSPNAKALAALIREHPDDARARFNADLKKRGIERRLWAETYRDALKGAERLLKKDRP